MGYLEPREMSNPGHHQDNWKNLSGFGGLHDSNVIRVTSGFDGCTVVIQDSLCGKYTPKYLGVTGRILAYGSRKMMVLTCICINRKRARMTEPIW